jgi:hypothetical protein
MSAAFGLTLTATAPKAPPLTTMKPSRPAAIAGSVMILASVSTQNSLPLSSASSVLSALIVSRTV